jgi:hypothetical protein
MNMRCDAGVGRGGAVGSGSGLRSGVPVSGARVRVGAPASGGEERQTRSDRRFTAGGSQIWLCCVWGAGRARSNT